MTDHRDKAVHALDVARTLSKTESREAYEEAVDEIRAMCEAMVAAALVPAAKADAEPPNILDAIAASPLGQARLRQTGEAVPPVAKPEATGAHPERICTYPEHVEAFYFITNALDIGARATWMSGAKAVVAKFSEAERESTELRRQLDAAWDAANAERLERVAVSDKLRAERDAALARVAEVEAERAALRASLQRQTDALCAAELDLERWKLRGLRLRAVAKAASALEAHGDKALTDALHDLLIFDEHHGERLAKPPAQPPACDHTGIGLPGCETCDPKVMRPPMADIDAKLARLVNKTCAWYAEPGRVTHAESVLVAGALRHLLREFRDEATTPRTCDECGDAATRGTRSVGMFCDDHAPAECPELPAQPPEVITSAAVESATQASESSGRGCGHVPRPGWCGGCRESVEGIDRGRT